MRLDGVAAFHEAFASASPARPTAVAMYRSCVAVGMSSGVVFVLMPRMTDAGCVDHHVTVMTVVNTAVVSSACRIPHNTERLLCFRGGWAPLPHTQPSVQCCPCVCQQAGRGAKRTARCQLYCLQHGIRGLAPRGAYLRRGCSVGVSTQWVGNRQGALLCGCCSLCAFVACGCVGCGC